MTPELNPRQREAAESPEKPLLIVAGAGTGKTRTLTGRLLHLMERGVPPESICAITFTNKAAREMAERIRDASPRVWANDTNINSDSQFAALKRNSHHSRRGMPFIGTFHSLGARILRAEAKTLGRNANFVIFDDHDSLALVKKTVKFLGEKAKKEGPAFFADKVTQIKNGMLPIQELKSSPREADRLALKILARYEAELQKHNAFDFDDLIQKVVLLFKSRPAALAKYQKRFRHILVDEYQDLNHMQYELVRLLAGNSRKISVVGDEAQCIYSWRGSNAEIFLNFEKDWPDAAVVVLEENYRSSQNIITAASALIKNNVRQKPKNLWTRNAPGELVKLVEAGDEDEEAEWIADKIAASGKRQATTAVLYRTNAQSRALEQALIERNVPYRVFGGIKFYERKEVKDILAGLRYSVNSEDALSRERLEKTFGKNRFADFASALTESSENKREAEPVEMIRLFLEKFGYFEHLKKTFTNWAERRENVAELLYFAAKFKSLAPFLEEVALLQATDAVKGDDKKQGTGEVQLMTIHLAKGLEFDGVFVAGCTEGILPHARSMGSPAELEEERRLLYVAMTRAKKELCLSFYDLPSRFLSEIPEELVQFESLVSPAATFSDDEERYITLE